MYDEFDNDIDDREKMSESKEKEEASVYVSRPSGGVYSGQRQYNYSGNSESRAQREEGAVEYRGKIYGTGIEEPKKKKSKIGFFAKAVAILVALTVFGASAGGTLYYLNSYMNREDSASRESGLTEKEDAEAALEEEASENSANKSEAKEDDKEASKKASGIMAMDVSEVVEQVMPSVVAISSNYTVTRSDFFGQVYSEEANGSGSGIIIGKDDENLYIATNNHVVEDTDSLAVRFIDGSTAEARIKGTDSSIDLAVIVIDLDDLEAGTEEKISVAKLGDSSSLKVGQAAIAIGNALGYGQSVTVGVISAMDRTISINDETTANGLIQTDAAINPGNSGGALVNINGEVIGINSSKIGGSTIDGVGFAIPISSAEPILSGIASSDSRIKVSDSKAGYLGIGGVAVTSEASRMYGMPLGILVRQVYAGTGAETAGMQLGDVIVSIADKEVSTMEELKEELAYYEAGESVKIMIYRITGNSYEKVSVDIVLSDKATLEAASNIRN